ncbi:fungal-specific transcription factor domain-containing protein [Microdochium trichocladiopsis]|uniref:Fungal-specific transcription factor domain-containing protein n=1 Tax=Microdochium trichocladiopsis TaxID=1682393 RepID=A0A9P8Y5Q9_9PEZI|nr:fungal-specific transcription factor domain-containing protein [Microdochium trichocladiopsis]KAH7029535.1 fungal-specific transcription factor domain-containing protein [Microdochium trichocladiopsis]
MLGPISPLLQPISCQCQGASCPSLLHPLSHATPPTWFDYYFRPLGIMRCPAESKANPGSSKALERGSQRTRTGCWACRGRGVKCDEARPTCQKCTKRGLSCQYGIRLQWVEDSVARGICHGREGVWSGTHSKTEAAPAERQSQSQHADKSRTPVKTLSTSLCSRPSQPVTFFLNTSTRHISKFLVNEYSDCDANGVDVPAAEGSEAHKDNNFSPEELFNYPCVAHSPDRALRHRISTSQRKKTWPNMTPAAPLNLTGLAHPVDEMDCHILQYYNQVVCAKASLVDDEHHNHFRYVFMPMTAFSESTLSAVLSVAATKLSLTDPRYRRKALLHRQRVLAGLGQLLQSIFEDSTRWLEALACTMILCWCDIADYCRPTWISHLKGVAGILDARSDYDTRDGYASRLIQFCRQYLVYHLVMAKATFRIDKFISNSDRTLSKHLLADSWPREVDTRCQSSSTNSDALSMDEENILMQLFSGYEVDALTDSVAAEDIISHDDTAASDYIECFQGFSNSLLLLINEICDLSNGSESREMDHVASIVERIRSNLESLIQLAPGQSYDAYLAQANNESFHGKGSLDSRLEVILATAEANRLAALLLLEDTCALRFPELKSPGTTSREEYIEKIISTVEMICDKEQVTAALPIWPIFIAGCSIVSEEGRLRVLSILEKFQVPRVFGSIPPACAVIEHVWRCHDLKQDENPRSSSANLSNPSMIQPPKLPGRKRRQKRHQAEPVKACTVESYPWERPMFMLGGFLLSLT